MRTRTIALGLTLIAALALQHRLVVLTRDPHFKEVDGLGLEFVT